MPLFLNTYFFNSENFIEQKPIKMYLGQLQLQQKIKEVVIVDDNLNR